MRNPCEAQVSSTIRPLLLQLHIPFVPNIPSHDVLSVPSLVLKSPRMMCLSSLGTAAIVDLVFVKHCLGIIRVCHGWGIGAYKHGMLLP